MNRDQYVDSIKTVFVALGKKAVLSRLISITAFFSLPVVGPVTSWIIEKVLSIAIKEGETRVFFEFIDMRTAQQGDDFEKAAMDFWSKTSGDPVAMKEAEDELLKSFTTFVRFNS